MYEYTADLISVVDGDTAHFVVRLGMDVDIKTKIRFAGINCPELNTPAGQEAKRFTEGWLKDHDGKVLLRTVKDKKEKYGRYLAWIYDLEATECLNELLISAKLAEDYK